MSSLNLAKLLLDKHRVLDSPVTISVIHDVIKIVFSKGKHLDETALCPISAGFLLFYFVLS